MEKLLDKRTLTPEKLVGMLQKKGTEISIEEAKKVVEMLYFLSDLIVDQEIKK
ncbi:hypothetical protein [Pedobacter panaciterrae]|uniref:hypothetical protein n=1 Tax=Pedobacter panaciterrae TaxID=363849 RepID=UPI0025937CA3|nr:hypothetical protein [uncultured Pedobacter sp.]